jgi:hypothetical protein
VEGIESLELVTGSQDDDGASEALSLRLDSLSRHTGDGSEVSTVQRVVSG